MQLNGTKRPQASLIPGDFKSQETAAMRMRHEPPRGEGPDVCAEFIPVAASAKVVEAEVARKITYLTAWDLMDVGVAVRIGCSSEPSGLVGRVMQPGGRSWVVSLASRGMEFLPGNRLLTVADLQSI